MSLLTATIFADAERSFGVKVPVLAGIASGGIGVGVLGNVGVGVNIGIGVGVGDGEGEGSDERGT